MRLLAADRHVSPGLTIWRGRGFPIAMIRASRWWNSAPQARAVSGTLRDPPLIVNQDDSQYKLTVILVDVFADRGGRPAAAGAPRGLLSAQGGSAAGPVPDGRAHPLMRSR